MSSSAWQNEEVARRFVEETRPAIPYHAEQLGVLFDLVDHFRPGPRLIVDLGCGDGLLARLLLAPGGLFVNVEHVASSTPEVEALWEALMIRHLSAHLGKPIAEVETRFRERPDAADNILAPVETQVAWLREIGFTHADCYFRWLELAVFGGVKPSALDVDMGTEPD
jgi:hypothetical protein